MSDTRTSNILPMGVRAATLFEDEHRYLNSRGLRARVNETATESLNARQSSRQMTRTHTHTRATNSPQCLATRNYDDKTGDIEHITSCHISTHWTTSHKPNLFSFSRHSHFASSFRVLLCCRGWLRRRHPSKPFPANAQWRSLFSFSVCEVMLLCACVCVCQCIRIVWCTSSAIIK